MMAFCWCCAPMCIPSARKLQNLDCAHCWPPRQHRPRWSWMRRTEPHTARRKLGRASTEAWPGGGAPSVGQRAGAGPQHRRAHQVQKAHCINVAYSSCRRRTRCWPKRQRTAPMRRRCCAPMRQCNIHATISSILMVFCRRRTLCWPKRRRRAMMCHWSCALTSQHRTL